MCENRRNFIKHVRDILHFKKAPIFVLFYLKYNVLYCKD